MPGIMTTTKPHIGFGIIERAERLADLDMDTLRRVYVGFGCDEEPSKRHAKLQTNGMTRGQLVSGILAWEFDKELEQ